MNTHTLRLPAAFLGEMKALLGAEYDAYIESFNDPWKPGLRVNGLKLSAGELKELVSWDLTPVPWEPSGFYYGPRETRPPRHAWY